MRWVGGLPLSGRLRLTVIAATIAAVSVLSVLSGVNEFILLRHSFAARLQTVTTVAADDTALALKYNNQFAARKSLEWLRSQDGVLEATLDSGGIDKSTQPKPTDNADSRRAARSSAAAVADAKAKMLLDSSTAPDAIANEAPRVDVGFTSLAQARASAPITIGGRRVGTVRVEAHLTHIGEWLGNLSLHLTIAMIF